MPRYKLIVEYEGTPFCGFQRQENLPSVQQTLEEAIAAFCQHPVRIHVAGRTDTGVHALGQVCHVDLIKSFSPQTVMRATNFYLRDQKVIVLKAEEVDETFHARFSAIARSYCYHILNRAAPPTYLQDRVWHVPVPLKVEDMKKGAGILQGKHNFNTFRAKQCQAASSIRTLDLLEVSQKDEFVFIKAKARSFLHHQVRNIVGALYWVGTGYWSINDLQQALAACDRSQGGPTAPAAGLYFTKVFYSDGCKENP